MEQIKDLVRSLRKRLGLKQDDCALRGGIKREEWSKVENGHNFASSHEMRVALAKGLRISVETLDDYIEGKIDVRDAAAASGEIRTAPKPNRTQFELAVDFAEDDRLLPETAARAKAWGEANLEASSTLTKIGWYKRLREIDAELRAESLEDSGQRPSIHEKRSRKAAG